MGEKRKPYATMLLKINGNTQKLEMFRMELWQPDNHMGRKFRLRVNGRWFPKGEKKFFTKTEVKEMFIKSV